MKRTLAEILAGLAVLVLLASFHHQISRLQGRDQDVANLRALVEDAVSRANSGEVQEVARRQALARLDSRLQQLEARIAEASASDVEARELRRELDATRQEADRFKAEIARDVSRTKELMDAYHQEVRAIDRKAAQGITQTMTHLEHLAARFLPDPELLSTELLAPAVQLNGDDTVGSGTLIYSQRPSEGREVESYVLTSYHVIRNILADSASARRDGIAVTIYTSEGEIDERADMVSHDRRIDAALLKLRSSKRYDRTARVLARARADKVRVWDRVYAVGCPLGNDPIPTQGEISSVANELNGSNYWMINAPTYFGNSGGGIFLADTRELVGVFSKIYTHGKGNPVVVPHMGLCTPMDLIYEWLDRENMAFVVESRIEPAATAGLPDLAAPPPSGN